MRRYLVFSLGILLLFASCLSSPFLALRPSQIAQEPSRYRDTTVRIQAFVQAVVEIPFVDIHLLSVQDHAESDPSQRFLLVAREEISRGTTVTTQVNVLTLAEDTESTRNSRENNLSGEQSLRQWLVEQGWVSEEVASLVSRAIYSTLNGLSALNQRTFILLQTNQE